MKLIYPYFLILMMFLLLGGFLASLWSASVFAAHGTGTHPTQAIHPGPQTGAQLIAIVRAITDWIFVVFLVTAVIFIVLAAFQFLTGGGDPGKVAEARSKLIYAAVAIAVAVSAGGFNLVIRNIIIGETQAIEIQILIEKKAANKLISLPVTPPDTKIAPIISKIQDKINSINHYDIAQGGWLVYNTDPAFPSNLQTMEPGKGYVFNMKETATLIVSGAPWAFEPINLTKDTWHIIGAPYGGIKLQGVIGTCSLSDIRDFADEDGNIPVNSETRLEQGEGYWIRSKKTCTLQKI